MSAVESSLVTVEQLLALPEDGSERELIRGQLREKPMTRRNRFHSLAVARIAHLLQSWLDLATDVQGEVHAGEVGVILRSNPDTVVGIDVALFSAALIASQTNETTLVQGAPILAVEVLSPSDRLEEIREKVLEYLAVGVALVWIVDPYFQTVQVHRPNASPEMFNREQKLSGGQVLPNLEINVSDIFGP